MPVTEPSAAEMAELVGRPLYEVWKALAARIEASYAMECTWNSGGRAWKYEYKYRRGGKTLCALYARENCIGLMIVFGKEERTKFEAERGSFAGEIQTVYDSAQTYHDGKWLMFEPADTVLFDDLMRLLRIKRKPNRE